ncbi:MAG TPA: hypothetical protein VHN19_07410 [Burkholderiales bacterium]|jgi:hypothetical protein|nr:hypothetical protein [Burkholderiales bacterium]
MPNRREWLSGASLIALQFAFLREALALGGVEKGIAHVKGDARINGTPAKAGMDVKAGDVVTTGPGSEIAFVIGRDAFLVRANSRVEIQGEKDSLIAAGLRILTGAVLSVFTPGQPKRVQTATATIGIRGTGLYVEAAQDKTYVCTCYGAAEIVSSADPSARELVRTTHHEQPRYVMAKGAPQMLMEAPVINHTDAELTLLESLCGRQPPFAPWPGEEINRRRAY